MRLVIGGAYQGKRAYVMGHFHIGQNDILDIGSQVDGASPSVSVEVAKKQLEDGACRVLCVSSFHLLVKYAMEQELDISLLIDRMLLAHPDIIVIMDEIGNGIIPLEREARMYRESVGYAGCRLAREAAQVVRVVCGIGTMIKSENQGAKCL